MFGFELELQTCMTWIQTFSTMVWFSIWHQVITVYRRFRCDSQLFRQEFQQFSMEIPVILEVILDVADQEIPKVPDIQIGIIDVPEVIPDSLYIIPTDPDWDSSRFRRRFLTVSIGNSSSFERGIWRSLFDTLLVLFQTYLPWILDVHFLWWFQPFLTYLDLRPWPG